MVELEKKGRVFIVEDDQNCEDLIRLLLKKSGHEVVGSVCWLAAAMHEVGNFSDLGVNVVTLDRDVFGGDVVKAGFIQKVRVADPTIKIVGLGASRFDEGLKLDVDIGKGKICRLGWEIDQLLNHRRLD